MKKFYVVGYDSGVDRVFKGFGCIKVKTLVESDIVVLTGGADIGANLYNEPHHPTMYTNEPRDRAEVDAYYEALGHNKDVAGICRGGQLIHALNGGKLWQHVDNHICSRGHELIDHHTKKIHIVSSCHHQMMRIDNHKGNEAFELVASAAESTRRETTKEVKATTNYFTDDVEVLWYPRCRSLAYQSHPEFGIPSDTRYFKELLLRYGMLDNDVEPEPSPRGLPPMYAYGGFDDELMYD